jgi:serralysin
MPAITAYSTTGDAYIDGVLGDYKWAVNSFTFSFPTSGSSYGTGYGSGENTDNFGAFSSAQQAATRTVLAEFASVANLKFTEIAETSTQHADFRYAMSDAPSTAWAYFPTTSAEGGDAWFNKSGGYYSSPAKGNYGYATYLHETGHSLGLEHAHEHYVMPADRDSMEYTVMSYRSYVGGSTTSGYTNETGGYAQSLMMYDIAALQHMYGANFTSYSGNTTYTWSPTTGEASVDGVGRGLAVANRIFQTVWDGGGIDTYDFSNYSTTLKVDLRPGEWTTVSTTQLAKLHWDGSKVAVGNIANALVFNGDLRSLIENAAGGSGADTITGNQAWNSLWGNAGADKLYGLTGDDQLTGGAGNDLLDGGDGFDTAVFSGHSTDFKWSQNADKTWTIVDSRVWSPDGTDTLAGIESLRFSNETLRIDDAPTPAFTEGNDSVSLSSSGGTFSSLGGNDWLKYTDGRVIVDGGVGTDTADFSLFGSAVWVDLQYSGYEGWTMDRSTLTGGTWREIADVANVENLVGTAHSDYLRGSAGNNVLYYTGGRDTLDGGVGTDTADFSLFGSAVWVDLQYSGYEGWTMDRSTLTGGTWREIADVANVENLVGTAHNDYLRGDAGNNVLTGSAGADTLFGGLGSDVFVFNSISDSLPGARDTIQDFLSEIDMIDLRNIDANSGIAGDQVFSFIGGSSFTGSAGELNFVNGVLSGDINGDKVTDFQMSISGVTSLATTDFYL